MMSDTVSKLLPKLLIGLQVGHEREILDQMNKNRRLRIHGPQQIPFPWNGNMLILQRLNAPLNCPKRSGQLVRNILQIHSTHSLGLIELLL